MQLLGGLCPPSAVCTSICPRAWYWSYAAVSVSAPMENGGKRDRGEVEGGNARPGKYVRVNYSCPLVFIRPARLNMAFFAGT